MSKRINSINKAIQPAREKVKRITAEIKSKNKIKRRFTISDLVFFIKIKTKGKEMTNISAIKLWFPPRGYIPKIDTGTARGKFCSINKNEKAPIRQTKKEVTAIDPKTLYKTFLEEIRL